MQNLFGQFDSIVRALQGANIRYAVAGGVATTIYGGIRTTRDIDFLVHSDDAEAMVRMMTQLGYHSNRQTIDFRESGLSVQRLWKRVPDSDDLLMLDLLLAQTPRQRRMLRYAVHKIWGSSKIRVVRPADLIAMKQARNSATDQVDIEVLKRALKK